jgi:serine/threonine-protein kinase|tara:strand:+ start:506 stop:1267 length:762 start_codon:yes stop_codon:yes gene_type:complete
MISRFIHFILAFLTVSIGLFILFDQVIMPAYIRKDQTITVMDVKGKLLDRALKELDSEGFKGVVFDTVYTSKVDPLTIIDQYPLSGQKVKRGRTIRLKIARQEKMILVPALVGKSRRSAEISLQQLGLQIDTVYQEFNPDYPKGTVAWQFPKQGDQIKKGLGLQITVSQGLPPDFFQVPQLFGLSMKKANSELVKARLNVGKISYQQNEDLVPYTVLDQSIAPGTVLDRYTEIDLIVSILDLQDIFDKLQSEK